MSFDSSHNVAGGSETLSAEPQSAQAMESGSSSCSPPAEEGGSSQSPSSPTSPQDRRHLKCPQQRHRRQLTSNVACQTDYTEEWSQMTRADAGTEATSSSSEGTLRLMIQNFKSMADTVRGPSKEIQGVNWRIMVMPRQHVVQKKGTQKCLGFFLQCCPEAYSDSWSCQAQAELRLISQKTNVPHFTRKTNHNYTAKENDWGYSCFMTWADILDENQGYIKEDRVILEVTVKAEPPKSILSHDEFKKSIQNWRELAERQFQRNCIDLAIEANSQALKFCKDRDADIKLQLEEQKAYFIEQKVRESIQRIEKGKDATKQPDDEGTSQTALRQALTASSTKHNHTKKDKGRKVKKQRPREPSPPSPPNSPPPAEVRVEEKPKTEKADTVKSKGPTEAHAEMLLSGHFNKNIQELFFGIPPDPVSWARRTRDEEDIYNTLARHLTDQLQQMNLAAADKDAFQYVQHLNFTEAERQNMIMEQQHNILQQMFDQNVFDYQQRKKCKLERKRKGTEEAISFREFIERQYRDHPNMEDEVDEEVLKMNVDLAPIFIEECRLYREAIIDRQPDDSWNSAAYFLWSDDDPCFWAEEDFYSERDSTVSSDSDRQYDGCIKAKRSKRDTGHLLNEPCRCVDKPVPVCEMGVQTDVVPQKQKCEMEKVPAQEVTKSTTTTVTPPAPAGRILKKPTSKKNKARLAEAAAAAAAAAAATHVVPPPTAPVPPVPVDHTAVLNAQQFPIVEGENVVNFGTFKIVAAPIDKNDDTKAQSVIPRILPMEYAMKFFPTAVPNGEDEPLADPNKVMEDWVRSWLIEAQKIKPTDGAYPQDLLSQYSEQVVTALSAVAMNFMNVRRVVQKMNEIVLVLNERTTVLKLSKVHAALFNLAGMNIEHSNDTKFSPIARDVEGDYVLVEQLNYMDEVKAKIEEQIAIDKETAKKVNSAMKHVEERIGTNMKTIKELEKKVEETDKSLKKIEKTTKTDLTNTKNQLTAEKERNANIARDLKEKNKDVKRLENKYSLAATERDDYFEKMKTLQKEMNALQKKQADEVSKLRREMSSLNESRKHLQAGIGERDNEMKSLNHQIEERNTLIKKQKADAEQEKQKMAALNLQVTQALERAKKAEIDLLTKELESGVALLERAHLDATKQRREMEEAAASRARNQSEMNNYINSRNDWNAIVEQIEGFIKKAKADYAGHIEQINAGKAVASLPRISVSKPPMPPTIIKVPPIVSVEPTKPTPGVIGSRPSGHIGSTISPQSRAPGSPIQKHSQVSPSSPVRHPGAIGTRPNGVPVNGSSSSERNTHESTSSSSSMNNQSNGGSILNSWAWPETIASIGDVVSQSPSSDLLSMQQQTSRVDQNGWDEQNNTWTNPTSMNQYMSPIGPSRSAFAQPPGWPRPQSAQQQPSVEQQRMMYINSPWPMIVDRVSKKLHVDQEVAFMMANQYIRERSLNVVHVNPDDVADAMYQKRYSETQRLPPGAAPGYLQNPLMGSFMDRSPIGPPLGSMLNNQDHLLSNLLSNDNIRPSSTADKWSTGL